jgi:uncharacterized protein with ATP-grasp and redox domains
MSESAFWFVTAPESEGEVAILPQLKGVESYRTCEWDLKVDPIGRRYWVDLFCNHIDILMGAIGQEYPTTSPDRLASFRSRYLAAMRSLDAEPERFERIDILLLDEMRSAVQNEFGFPDPYRGIKRRENELALLLLPELLDELEATPADGLVEKLAQGLMAGNLFDLGAQAAMECCQAQSADFRRLRATQPSRPWFMDAVDAWQARWNDGRAYHHVAFFVDNAGADICLGCIPLARWMLRKGGRVTLVANSSPALNDVTAPEVAEVLARVAVIDTLTAAALADQHLRVVASGGWAPLLDLTQLSGDCTAAVGDADLIILHGMGRAIESNSQARFTCDTLRLGVLKDEAVAQRLGAQLFDCVFQLELAS